MPKQYEQFKKDYDAIIKMLEAGELEWTKEKTGRVHFGKMIEEHSKEIGRRVRELRDKGTAGTTINDFKTDGEVKTLLAEAETYLGQMEAQNKRVKALEAGDWKKMDTSYQALQRDLTAEIAARKKQLSTKLGTGNKSVADMEKLLADAGKLKSRVVTLAKLSTRNAKWFTIANERKIMDDDIAAELVKSKDKALSQDQADLFASTLSDRNLKFSLATANSVYQKVLAAVTEAKTAKSANQAEELKAAQTKAAQEMKRLDEIADKHKKAYDGLGEMVILTNREGPKIKQAVTSMSELKQKAHDELAKMPKA